MPEKRVELAYYDRNITIEFDVLNYQSNTLDYKYQLLTPVDSQWVVTSAKMLVFSALSPGEYQLKLKSKIGFGRWVSSNPVRFIVIKPFWQTWWFVVGIMLLTMYVMYYVIRFSFARRVRVQKSNYNSLKLEQRALRAQKSPHFIFNIIASFQYLIAEGARKKAMRFLDLFSKSLRNLLDQSNSNYITVEDEIKFLSEYIELEKFRTEDSFDYRIESNQIGGKIPTFIIQPFVENAIKHGLKNVSLRSELVVAFSIEAKFIEVIVTDNGIGREASNPNRKKKQSHGIRLIKERLMIHNGESENVFIEDLKNSDGLASGTRVKIRIKLKSEME